MKKTILDVWNESFVDEKILMIHLGPQCDSVIDHVNPWRVLVFDRTLQSIAYKLVPNLYKGLNHQNQSKKTLFRLLFVEEIERQIAYYKERDLPYPPSLVGKKVSLSLSKTEEEKYLLIFKEKLQEKRDEEEQQTIPANSDLHIYDDQVAICLENKSKDLQVNKQSSDLSKQDIFD